MNFGRALRFDVILSGAKSKNPGANRDAGRDCKWFHGVPRLRFAPLGMTALLMYAT